jgi:uncharacterized damage-inducible protein DinB
MHFILKQTFAQLADLQQLVSELTSKIYAENLTVLHENSIGKHVRHIIEFYIELLNGLEIGEVDYDNRSRNLLLENDLEIVARTIATICQRITAMQTDKEINLRLHYNGETDLIQSSYFRELLYNIEHNVHHLAIIKIAMKQAFPEIKTAENLGIAASTLEFKARQATKN